MTWVNKIIQVSGVQIWILFCVFTTPSQVSFHPHLSSLNPLLPPPTPFPSGNHHPVVWVYEVIFSLLNPFTFSSSPIIPLPSDSSQSVLCVYGSLSIICYFIHLFITVTNEWNHVVFVLLWLAISLSIVLSRSIHAVAKGKIPSFLRPSSIQLCKCITAFLSPHLLMGTWAVSKSCLL